MPRRVFYSFHYQKDNWRVSQIRNIGAIEGNKIATDNEWEEVKKQGDLAIKQWINKNLENRSCLVVLIGEETSERKWVLYEIEEAWNRGMGVLGIYIHRIKDRVGDTSKMGRNPFDKFTWKTYRLIKKLNIPIYNPNILMRCDYYNNTEYNVVRTHLGNWIEEAIEYRKGKGNIVLK